MTDTSAVTSTEMPVTRTRGFWPLMGHAVGLGVFGAFFSLAFLGVIGVGGKWYTSSDHGWWGGHWWWLAVTTAAGVAVGLLRHLTKLPAKTPTLVDDLQSQHIEPAVVPGILAVSAISLIGGASLGPEQALGTAGGWAGGWTARRRGATVDDTKVNTLAGFAGAYGGLFSSVLIVVAFICEIASPGEKLYRKVLPATIIAGAISFAIYYLIAGSVFLDKYDVGSFAYHDWELAAGVGFGLLAAVIVLVLGIFMSAATALFGRLKLPTFVKSTIGGVLFGVVGVALPLSMFNGSEQLSVVISDQAALGFALIAVLIVAKMFTFSVSVASGFVGGPIFPALFIGGTAGVAVHLLFPDVPLGLAFSCLLVAVPGALIAAPFSLVLMAVFFTRLGALQTAPVLIAVITAFLAVAGARYLLAARTTRDRPETAGAEIADQPR
ncbi:chloride channel protein [Microlunatus elymi]|nr:chloride channel protein [Microlunatus elymi]